MNTPAHIIFGAAVFAQPCQRRVSLAAVAGGLLPDVPLIVMVGWSLLIAGIPPDIVFGHVYFSGAWQRVFAIDHSLFVWGGVLLAGVLASRPVVTAFAGSGLLHAAIDFLVHHDDARSQLWPLSWWKFRSPVSYYDGAHYGNIFGPAEIAVCLVLSVILWRRFPGTLARGLVVLLFITEAVPGLMFALMLH